MEEIIQQQHSTLASVLAKRTAAQWHDYPDFGPLIEPLKKTHDQPYSPGLQYLLQLVQLVSQADEELSTGVFILLESYCVIAEPTVAAQAIAHFILEAGEPFPSLPVKGKTSGWLELTLDYKYELRRKGTMVKKLWAIAASRGENIQRDGSVPAAFENQLLILVNLLDRIFMWFESKDSEECIDQLKLRVTGYARTPELFLFVMDNVLKYLDGRWIRDDTKENIVIQPKVTSTSLIEINRNREPIRYSPTGQQGTPGSTESSHIARGKALKEREVRVDHGREARVREYELSDLVARCLDGQDSDTREQFVLRFLQHLMLRIDTVMVNASSAALKQAAHQR
ncbi:hypothetical protein BGX28_009550 [Mortierella sp. GBA30]|nr:hypothetical protein BGX28_009550 [Mortierella sp. GBA30]